MRRDSSFLPVHRVLEVADAIRPGARMMAEASGERDREGVGGARLRDVRTLRCQSRRIDRPRPDEGDVYRFADIEVDSTRCEVRRATAIVEVTPNC